jgi:hypothetical protein
MEPPRTPSNYTDMNNLDFHCSCFFSFSFFFEAISISKWVGFDLEK